MSYQSMLRKKNDIKRHWHNSITPSKVLNNRKYLHNLTKIEVYIIFFRVATTPVLNPTAAPSNGDSAGATEDPNPGTDNGVTVRIIEKSLLYC